MKVISINTNGIRAASRKGFFDWLAQEDPDFVCIQETKAHIEQLDQSFFPEGYTAEYFSAEKKGYSGVAIYAKKAPKNITTVLDFPLSDLEGRYLQFDYDDLSVISLYLPSGSSGDERQVKKYEFLDFFETHMLSLKKEHKNVIICGDWNIVHKEIDIKNFKANQKTSGCLPEERAWLDKVFGELGFIDGFRVKNSEPHQYTWWSNRGRAWDNNVGWRIDYQVITEALADKVRSVSIYKETRFSDHAPLIIEYDL